MHLVASIAFAYLFPLALVSAEAPHLAILETYCFGCHDEDAQKGGVDLSTFIDLAYFDGTLAFENLITGKMPPADRKQPTANEKQVVLRWLTERQTPAITPDFRRVSRHEFVHAANDLLGTDLDLAHRIPEVRGSHDFDSDQRIALGAENLAANFSVADQLLKTAFQIDGFPVERRWETSRIRDSHGTSIIYHRPYEDGIEEGSGTLLNNTTVVIGSNFGNASNHTCNSLPTIVAGHFGSSEKATGLLGG